MTGIAHWLWRQSGLGTKVPPGFLRRPREKCRGPGEPNPDRRPKRGAWRPGITPVKSAPEALYAPNPAMKAPLHGRTVPSWRNTIRMTEPNRLTPRGVPDHKPAAGGIAARARAAATPQYLAGLNLEQREAVETLDGPVLVLAGAGTGKTRVLTCRIAHILSQGRARPGEILSVTFTNKAAREMKLRLGQMLGQAVEGMPWLGTFHSNGGRILRTHAELVQLKSNFTVLDVDDQVRLLKQLLSAENIDDKRWPARMLAGLIDGWKNRGLTPSQVPSGEAAVLPA